MFTSGTRLVENKRIVGVLYLARPTLLSPLNAAAVLNQRQPHGYSYKAGKNVHAEIWGPMTDRLILTARPH